MPEAYIDGGSLRKRWLQDWLKQVAVGSLNRLFEVFEAKIAVETYFFH